MAITRIETDELLKPPIGPDNMPLGHAADIGQFSVVISQVLGFFTLIAGLAFLFYFAFAAVTMITSGDDQQKLTNARKNMTQALVGIAIVATTYPLIWLITTLLGIPLTDPDVIFTSYLEFVTP